MSHAPRRAVGTPLGAAAALALLAGAARPGFGQDCVFLVEGTAWLHHPAPPPADWTDPDAADDPETTGWSVGCAPFGTDGCGFTARTPWPLGSTWYLRQHVWLTGAESGLTARVAIDNDFELFVNATSVGSLSKEGCATRWDAVIPIPDALWRVGDNLVAVRIVDRGGFATFDMTLDGSAGGAPCPPGCARLPCGAEGPVVQAPPAIGCPGVRTELAALASWAEGCGPGLVLRRVLPPDPPGPWGPGVFSVVTERSELLVEVQARCSQSPTCPVGSGAVRLTPLAGPPGPLGPVLRVRRRGGLAVLDWSSGPQGPLEHAHVLSWPALPGLGYRANPESDASTGWEDPDPGGRAFYRVVPADECEREAPTP